MIDDDLECAESKEKELTKVIYGGPEIWFAGKVVGGILPHQQRSRVDSFIR